MMIFYLFLGVGLLYLGAEWMIRGGAGLAFRLGLPLLVIGLIIIGYGTGTPELVVSVEASLAGKGDISIGNVIGSNIVNTGLVLGMAAMVRPIPIQRRIFNVDIPVMIIAAFILSFIFLKFSGFNRLTGAVLLFGLVCYTAWSIYYGKNTYVNSSESSRNAFRHWILEAMLILLGLSAIILGGTLFLKGAIGLAHFYGISDRVIGLTVVALGTSLPELAASIVSAFRKQGEMAIGNVVGSNIFNMLGIIGTAALISPIYPSSIQWVDFIYMLVLFIGMWVISKQSLHVERRHGLMMFCSYLVYIGYLFYLN